MRMVFSKMNLIYHFSVKTSLVGHSRCSLYSTKTFHTRFMCTKTSRSKKPTVDVNELEKFQKEASSWWDKNGPFKLLHSSNDLRVPFIRDGILSTNPSVSVQPSKPLSGFRIIDVGCGGGLLTEPLARLGAIVTGIDPIPENIKIAEEHALLDVNIKDRLTYICCPVESLAEDKSFDALVCSEVIEHVENPELFVECCTALVKPEGSLFFTTINRTTLSYIVAILGAEYVMGYLPKGTHRWEKFVKPIELENMFKSTGCYVRIVHGMLFNPVSSKWQWSAFNGVNFAMHAVKKS